MRTLRFLVFIFLAFVPYLCFAQQQSNWDETLDRYELICERCLELKRNQEAGQNVPKESISSLKTQLTMLRNSLLQVQGQMSAAQKARFNMIRQRFGENPAAKTISSTKLVKEAKAPDKKTEKEPVATADEIKIRDTIPSLKLTGVDTGNLVGKADVPVLPDKIEPLKFDKEQQNTKRRNEYLIAAQAAVYPLQSYGLMAGILLKADNNVCWGAYIKGLSDFRFKKITPGYSCDPSGTMDNGKKVWTDGETTGRRFSFSVGGIARLGTHFGLYLGAGYGSSQYYLKDVNDVWVSVSGISARGVILEAGINGFFGRHFYASAGVSSTAFRYIEPQLGIGIRF